MYALSQLAIFVSVPDKKSKDHLLQRRIDEILCYIWDPIGVSNGRPESRDEYTGYVDGIYQAVVRGATKEELVRLLETFATDDMGLEDSEDRQSVEVADIILEWATFLNDR